LDVGDPIGKIGNTGNTTESHLHVHAVPSPSPGVADAAASFDPLSLEALAVPFSIDGKFLVRGSRVPSSWRGVVANGQPLPRSVPR